MVSKEFRIEIETYFLAPNKLSFKPGLVHSRLKIKLKTTKAKNLNPVDIDLSEIVTFCEAQSLNLIIISSTVIFVLEIQ